MSVSSQADANELGGVGPVDEMGPIDFYCMEFPQQQAPGDGFRMLVQLVDRGIIRVLDLAFVKKEADGSVRRVALSELGPDAAVFEGASSGLLDEEDFAQAGELIGPNSAAGLLVIENHWAAPLATTLRRQGAQLVAAERLPVQAILAALDAAEARQ